MSEREYHRPGPISHGAARRWTCFGITVNTWTCHFAGCQKHIASATMARSHTVSGEDWPGTPYKRNVTEYVAPPISQCGRLRRFTTSEAPVSPLDLSSEDDP